MEESQGGQTQAIQNQAPQPPAGVMPAAAPPASTSPVPQQTPASPQPVYTGTVPVAAAYTPAPDIETAPPPRAQLQPVAWTASEFIAHEKDSTWYGALTLGTIVIAALTYLLTRDFVSIVVVLFAAGGLAYLAGRQPGTQQYMLDREGLHIGPKLYPFHDFKNFSLAAEGAMPSVVLAPLKRFMPPVTVYIDPEQANAVVDFLAAYLPIVPHKPDSVDKLMGRLRF